MALPNVYDIGDTVKLQATIRRASDETPVDPTTVTFKMKEPDATTTIYVYGTHAEVVREGTGVYYVQWPIDQWGRHSYRFEATGNVRTAEETVFNVNKSAFY